MNTSGSTRSQVIGRLKQAEAEIRGLGVRRLALFGSVVRDEAGPDSDVDLLVEFDADAKTFDAFLKLCDLLETLLERPVELITTEALSPYIGPHILAEAEDIFLSPDDTYPARVSSKTKLSSVRSCEAWRSSERRRRSSPTSFEQHTRMSSGTRWPACGTG